jgi:hypothetical protein
MMTSPPVTHYFSGPTGKIGLNQVGLFRDAESLGLSALKAKNVFAAAEKPLLWEVIGRGISNGKPGSWDNIHQWPLDAKGSLPPTPGMNMGLHNHWRWFPGSVDSWALPASGKQYAGPGGPGSVMIDPQLPDQSLSIAIMKRDIVADVLAAYTSNAIDNFDDLFLKSPNRLQGPESVKKGADLASWFSYTVHRDLTGELGPIAPSDFGGSLFVHGLFFSHDTLRTVLAGFPPYGAVDPMYIPRKPKRSWVRP